MMLADDFAGILSEARRKFAMLAKQGVKYKCKSEVWMRTTCPIDLAHDDRPTAGRTVDCYFLIVSHMARAITRSGAISKINETLTSIASPPLLSA